MSSSQTTRYVGTSTAFALKLKVGSSHITQQSSIVNPLPPVHWGRGRSDQCWITL